MFFVFVEIFYSNREEYENHGKICAEPNDACGGEVIEIFIVGFVVEIVPFGSEVVRCGAVKIIGKGEGLDACAKNRIGKPCIYGSLPDVEADLS